MEPETPPSNFVRPPPHRAAVLRPLPGRQACLEQRAAPALQRAWAAACFSHSSRVEPRPLSWECHERIASASSRVPRLALLQPFPRTATKETPQKSRAKRPRANLCASAAPSVPKPHPADTMAVQSSLHSGNRSPHTGQLAPRNTRLPWHPSRQTSGNRRHSSNHGCSVAGAVWVASDRPPCCPMPSGDSAGRDTMAVGANRHPSPPEGYLEPACSWQREDFGEEHTSETA
mmetsp:Transcript_50561/g.134530  ORF Transcript_50561/g.134530 Transcript_50561/m.134530 type:complete len:231 (+) Transcript_50561:1450-2142(+)